MHPVNNLKKEIGCFVSGVNPGYVYQTYCSNLHWAFHFLTELQTNAFLFRNGILLKVYRGFKGPVLPKNENLHTNYSFSSDSKPV